jgi:hypothetical protein
MKSICSKFIFLLSFLVIYSCAFEFSNDSYTLIDQEINPDLTLSISDFENSTILKKNRLISYSISDVKSKRLFELRFYIDDKEIFKSSNLSDSFWLYLFRYADGGHVLKVEYIYSSGTNSLADKDNKEVFIKTEQYQFFIDKSVAKPVTLEKVEIREGTIYLNWSPLVETNFENAQLLIYSENILQEEINITLQDLNKLEYHDSKSVKNNLSYQMKLSNEFNQTVSNVLQLDFDSIDISQEVMSNNSYKITWTEHPLYANFDYFIHENSDEELSVHGGAFVFTENYDIVFGSTTATTRYFTLYRDNVSLTSISASMFRGKLFEKPGCQDYIYVEELDKCYALELNGKNYYQSPREVILHELNPNDFSIVNSKYIRTIYDSQVSLIFDSVTKNIVLDFLDKSILINTSDFEVFKEWEVSNFNNKNYYHWINYFRNEMVMLYSTSGDDEISIYNSKTKKIVFEEDENIRSFSVTHSGKYIFCRGSIYKYENSKFEISATIEKDTGLGMNFVKFFPKIEKCIYYQYDEQPFIIDLKTNYKKSIPIRDNRFNKVSIDEKNGKILFVRSDNSEAFIKIYNIETGNLKSMKVERWNSYKLLNNKLLSSEGIYLDTYINN